MVCEWSDGHKRVYDLLQDHMVERSEEMSSDQMRMVHGDNEILTRSNAAEVDHPIPLRIREIKNAKASVNELLSKG